MKLPAFLSNIKHNISQLLEQYFKVTMPSKTSWALAMDKISVSDFVTVTSAEPVVTFNYYPNLFSRKFPFYQNYQTAFNPIWAKIAMQHGIQPKARANVYDMQAYLDKARHKAISQPSAPFKAGEVSPMPAYRIVQKADAVESIFPITPAPKP